MVERTEGGTASERYLAKLCERSFLRLWSYPNVYVDKRKAGRGDGKELCDLLVVCGDHVLIFSDKTVGWHGNDLKIAWKRWYNRAIHHSVRQIRKAERWISQMPDRIYLDKECTKPFPFDLPPIERRKVHGVVVALGAGEPCKAFFGEGSGSLMLIPELTGDAHLKADEPILFAVGDVDPNGPFVHVLDDATLDIVMGELDTITDFTAYLTKKASFFRSGKMVTAGGEDDLVAYYMSHMSSANEHDFTRPDGTDLGEKDTLSIASGYYSGLESNAQYQAKKKADEDSYVWDMLISTFAKNMIEGTSITADGAPFVLSASEKVIRHMALVPRFVRRMYGKAIVDLYEIGRDQPRFTRSFLPGEYSFDKTMAFFFMTLAVPRMLLSGGYDQYRAVRRKMLETHGLAMLLRHPRLKKVIGIATEPATENGSSEDIILIEDVIWTPKLIEVVEKLMKHYDIMQPNQAVERHMDEWEFPP